MESKFAKDIASSYTASYAAYVATSRAIPSLVDGLKPVHRKCVNSASDLKLYHNKPFLKVAKLEGQVMGDYSPHGGASPVILAQPFKIRYPLFEGQGNFGSPDNPNSVAASRYIECRLTKFCEEFYLSSADYADREDNYDGRLKEVVRYYPPIPGSLLTGSSGIAVGLSTNIPSHTVSDVCNSFLAYLKNPDSSRFLKLLSPETCEESIVLTPKKDIEKLYRTGEGSIQYKAKTHYESIEGKLALVVDAFPPDYRKKSLESASILEAVETGALELRNESKEGIRYVFLSSDRQVLKSVEDKLVSSTSYRMYIENEGKIKCYTLPEIYDEFVKAKIVYITRKYTDLIQKNHEELEYIRVLLLLKSDKEYLKSMFEKSPREVTKDIIERYSTKSSIASRVISSSLSSMMRDNTEKLLKKRQILEQEISEYTTYLEDPLIKIRDDVQKLHEAYKSEVRRAVHIDEVEDSIEFEYRGETITAHPSAMYYVADCHNSYKQVHATELLEMDLSDKFIAPADNDYYILYDSQGLVAVTSEVMSRLENKFRSSELCGLIGTNELERISFSAKGRRKPIQLGDWALRTRASYIRLADDRSMKLVE